MISREIECTYCGLRGEIGLPNSKVKQRRKNVFRHLGHNPISGHLHYQCPGCSIVLLVHPMDVLEGASLQGIPSRQPQAMSMRTAFMEILDPLKAFRKIFPHPWFPATAGIRSMRHPDAHIDAGGI